MTKIVLSGSEMKMVESIDFLRNFEVGWRLRIFCICRSMIQKTPHNYSYVAINISQ